MTRILRSMLYVPSNSWRMINNSTSEGADAIILDLEDGCPMAEKETGRVFARDSIPMLKEHGLDVFVRINSMETGLTGTDIQYVVVPGLDGIMLAKTEAQEDVRALDSLLKEQEKKKGIAPGGVQVMALLETPKGILNIREIIADEGLVMGEVRNITMEGMFIHCVERLSVNHTYRFLIKPPGEETAIMGKLLWSNLESAAGRDILKGMGYSFVQVNEVHEELLREAIQKHVET